ncbi:MAG: stalk domain-containing protein [Clostridia bacterium]|nr:stalk domain-containing protein [Clostridia bacterium]
MKYKLFGVFIFAALIILIVYGRENANIKAANASINSNYKIIINGSLTRPEVPPLNVEGRLMVPFRYVFEALGGTVEWDGNKKTVKGIKNSNVIQFRLNERIADVNGKAVSMDVAPLIRQDRVLVPLRFSAENLNAQVEFSKETNTVTISTKITQGEELLHKINKLQKEGKLNEADSLIQSYLKDNAPDENVRKLLEFELERNKRIILDYSLDEETLYNSLKKLIPDLSRTEYKKWQNEGRFDILTVNGSKRFLNSSKSNLFFRYPELKKRRVDYSKADKMAKEVLNHIKNLKEKSKSVNGWVKLPKNGTMQQTLTLKKGVVPTGESLRCWLPYPIVFENQDNIKKISSSASLKSIDKETSSIRSVYFETKANGNVENVFDVKYSYTSYSKYMKKDPEKVGELSGNETGYIEYTKEEPHIVFSEKMIKLAGDIAGSETNPYLKGKKIYDWICDNIKYSYAREYSTLGNLGEYCLDKKYGDCGQEAMLFITLCRISGIPARWQSGFLTFPSKQIPHDWAEIHIKPYGWIPVDTYMGVYFTSVTEDLTAGERKEIRDFYYGNIDAYRIVFNKGHNRLLIPPKEFVRSDDVDFQRGEIESGKRNLYFNQWNYRYKIVLY